MPKLKPGVWKVIAHVPAKDASLVHVNDNDFVVISMNDLPEHFNGTLYPEQLIEVDANGTFLKSVEDRKRHANLLSWIAQMEGDGTTPVPDHLKERLAAWWEELKRYQPVDPTAKSSSGMRTNATVDWSKEK